MKALSIKEPWASYIRNGFKTIETRTWPTPYREKLLLCASKHPKSLISGKAFAVVELVDCRDMTMEDEQAAMCEWYPGAYSWIFENVRSIDLFPVRGQLGLFDVEYGDESIRKVPRRD